MATSPPLAPLGTLGSLPAEVLDMVFTHLLYGVTGNKTKMVPAYPHPIGNGVHVSGWANAAPLGAVCRFFRASFLGAVRGLFIDFKTGPCPPRSNE